MNFGTTIDVSGSRIKIREGSILNADGTLVNDTDGLASTESVLVNPNDTAKVLRNQTIIPIEQSLNFNTPLSLSNINAMASGTTLVVPVTQSSNLLQQPVQMYQSESFEDNIIDQQTSSGQTFLIAPPGTVLSSNSMVSHGQVFIQGDDLVGLSLPTSNAYSVATNDSHYNAVSLMQSGNQNVASSQSRIVIQQSQSGTNISSPIISSNNGHYLIQVKNTLPNISQNGNFSINNKGHIVIKSGGGNSKLRAESQENLDLSTREGVYKVIIPKGTTKLPKVNHPVIKSNENDDFMKKHVQINLSNRASYGPVKDTYDTAVQTAATKAINEEKPSVPSGRKLYECNNCNNKFMKALYLRMHMRSCKKPEVKPEKMPLYMCSFCKATFKTRPQIHHHFSKCSNNPSNSKDSSEKVVTEDVVVPPSKKSKLLPVTDVDSILDQAVQYKCQDCDRTFNKERQYTSHIKRCTNVSVHDLSGMKAEQSMEMHEDDHDSPEDPFADPVPVSTSTSRRGRGSGGRRGRPPGRIANAANKSSPRNNALFEGEQVVASSSGLIVADSENMVRSTTGLAHTVQMSLETALQEGQPQPRALVSDSKGVRGRVKPPQAWSLVCSLCQKMFLTKAALANHVIDSHGPDLQETRDVLLWKNNTQSREFFRCPLCDLHYELSQNFLEHLVLQHTNKLQECHRNLQEQTASFVCSMCSLVLLTKNLLLEHLSLEHLEELEKVRMATIARKKKGSFETTESQEEVPSLKKDLDAGNLECRLCGEDFHSQELLITHYVSAHNIEMDEEGFILDLGVDVDIRIKDTKRLIQLADGKVGECSLPPKTVLIRKRPKQSWQCQNCLLVFARQAAMLRHIRDVCPGEKNQGNQKDSKFFCHHSECNQISFHQFKSLLKHREDIHHEEVKKDRRTFPNLSAFYDWLAQEEQTSNVRFVRQSSRIEKSSTQLLQLVCHRFHSTKPENDATKPTKKRWFVRIERENNCHSRIILRIDFDKDTKQFDGETQMLFYREHFHNEIEQTPESLEEMFPLGRQLHKIEAQPEIQQQQPELLSSSATTNSDVYLLSGQSDIIIPEGSTNGLCNDAQKSMEEAYMVDEEYVLPADESEWNKLFDVLANRLETGEIVPQDQKEAQALLQYKNVISGVNLSEQVAIFHKMCTLTNTSLEAA